MKINRNQKASLTHALMNTLLSPPPKKKEIKHCSSEQIQKVLIFCMQ